MRTTLIRATCLTLLTVISSEAQVKPAFRNHVLVANKAKYKPDILDPSLVNAWGIAIRPAGLGGHFWIANYGKGTSDEYVGDVGGIALYQDGLKTVTIPNSAPSVAGPTGVVFNPYASFTITQAHPNGPITAPAKFLFATDNGTISAWTERKVAPGVFDWPADALTVIDRREQGSAFFGLAVGAAGTSFFTADFGKTAGIREFDAQFNEVTSGLKFLNPWAKGANKRNLTRNPGLFTPFNIQTLTVGESPSLFVPYAKTQRAAKSRFLLAGEEDAGKGKGRLAQFDFQGNLIAKWRDRGLLNAPWGVAVAPTNFGKYDGMLLVGNVGDGTIVAFNPTTRAAVDYLRDAKGKRIVIEGLWGILAGNGASLGEASRLYYAAGPADEEDGTFGYIELAPASQR
jgi:uncharacterized protein (TIGR03118 family)